VISLDYTGLSGLRAACLRLERNAFACRVPGVIPHGRRRSLALRQPGFMISYKLTSTCVLQSFKTPYAARRCLSIGLRPWRTRNSIG